MKPLHRRLCIHTAHAVSDSLYQLVRSKVVLALLYRITAVRTSRSRYSCCNLYYYYFKIKNAHINPTSRAHGHRSHTPSQTHTHTPPPEYASCHSSHSQLTHMTAAAMTAAAQPRWAAEGVVGFCAAPLPLTPSHHQRRLKRCRACARGRGGHIPSPLKRNGRAITPLPHQKSASAPSPSTSKLLRSFAEASPSFSHLLQLARRERLCASRDAQGGGIT